MCEQEATPTLSPRTFTPWVQFCTSRVSEMQEGLYGLHVYWMTTRSNKVGVVSGYAHFRRLID